MSHLIQTIRSITKGVLALCLAVILLAGCGGPKNKIGSTVKGSRIAILEPEKPPEADQTAASMKPEEPPSVDNSAWPQAGFDPSHMIPNSALGEHPKEIWHVSIGDGSDDNYKLLAHPVIAEGRILTMDARGLIHAFTVSNGKELWHYDMTPEDSDPAIGGGLAIDGKVVYATSGTGEVFALNLADGKVIWRRALANPIRSAPTVADGRVYAVTIDNQLNALDAATGEVLWHHNGISESATLMGGASPAVIGDSVLTAYSSGEIYLLRAVNGRVAWNYSLITASQMGALPAIADIRGLPVLDHGRVYAVSHSGRMAAIDTRTGDRAWEVEIGGVDTPVVTNDTIFVLSADDRLIAMTRDEGKIIWTRELQKLSDPDDKKSDHVFWTGPVLAGGKLWLANSIGQVIAYDLDDGAKGQVIDLDTPILISPIAADHKLFVVTDDGDLVALQ